MKLTYQLDVEVKNNALTRDTPTSELTAIVALIVEQTLERKLTALPWVVQIDVTP
jgi:hypothetical protein